MTNLNEVMAKTMEMKWKIESLLKLSTYNDYDDLSGLSINYDNLDELFLMDELREIMNQLTNVRDKIKYLFREIKETSCLQRNR